MDGHQDPSRDPASGFLRKGSLLKTPQPPEDKPSHQAGAQAAGTDGRLLPEYASITADVALGTGIKFGRFINLYGCSIGDDTRIGAFVEIQKNATVGSRCKISSHTFICEGVTIEDEVFVGHGVTFINDSHPRATARGALQTEADWTVEPTLVKRGASIGSGSTILSNVVIGEEALVGAGSVVTRDVPARAIVVGNPARMLQNSDRRPRSSE